METYDDKKLVKICLEELCEKLGLPKGPSLNQSDYEFICYQIEEQTGVIISLSTIKRVFKEKYERLPQLATLDAICKLVGYDGWRDFKSEKLKVELRPLNTGKNTGGQKRPLFSVKRVIVVPATLATVLVMVLVVYLSYSSKPGKEKEGETNKRESNISTSQVIFSAKKEVGSGIPNTVVFSYNIDHIEADSFFIQQSWDKRRRVKIFKNNYTQTDIYFEPGSYKAKLIANDSVLKEIDVVVNSEKWLAYTKVDMEKPPVYYNQAMTKREDVMRIPVDEMKAEGLAPETDMKMLHFYSNFSEGFRKFRNDFRFNTRLQLNPLNKAPCFVAAINFMASDGMVSVPVISSGCTSQIGLQISDVAVNGKKTDLSGFGIEADKWYDLEILTENNKASVYINDTLTFEKEYNVPIGFLAGVYFVSNGLLEVDYVKLDSQDRREQYFEDFTNY